MRMGERVTAARPMNEPTSMWSGPIGVRRPVQRGAAVHGHGVGADPLDARAEGGEEVREVLHVRLARGVAEHRGALAATAAMSAFSVPVTLGSSRKIVGAAQLGASSR
jgi:hypothetical protein